VAHTDEPVADENRFATAGIDQPQAVAAALAALQSAVAADDRAAVAALVVYPFSTYNNGTVVKTYTDANALLADYDLLFPASVRAIIAASVPGNVFVNAHGVMLGNGEIWMNTNGDSGALKITAINPPPAPQDTP
jgi:hypothetical protein